MQVDANNAVGPFAFEPKRLGLVWLLSGLRALSALFCGREFMLFRIKAGWATCCAAILITSTAQAAGPARILVMETPSTAKTVEACQILDDVLVADVASHAPKGMLVTSSKEVALMAEHAAHRQMMGCANEDCFVNFADAVNADILVMPTLRRVANEYMVSVRTVAPKQGGVIGREVVYTRANFKSLIEAGHKLGIAIQKQLQWGAPETVAHFGSAESFQWASVGSGDAAQPRQAGMKTAGNSINQPKQRLVIVTRETIDGKPNSLSPAGNALTRALKQRGYKIVAQDVAKRLRKQNTVALMMDGELPEEVSSLDADLLLVGVADASYAGNMMADVETYTSTMEVKTIRLDTAEVADAFSTTVSHGFFSKIEAGRGSLKKAGSEAGKHFGGLLVALQNAPKSMEIMVHGIPNRRAGSEVKNRLKNIPELKNVVVRQSSKSVTKIEFVTEVSSEDLADLLDDDLSMPIEVLQSSRNALLARYDESKGLKLGVLLLEPVGKVSKESRWVKGALPDLLQTELQNIDYLEIANDGAGPAGMSGNRVTAASVKKAAKQHERVPLVLSTSLKRAKKSVLITVKIHDAQSGKPVYSTKVMTSPENLSQGAEKLIGDVKNNLLKKLAKRTLKRTAKQTQQLIVAANKQSTKSDPLVTRLEITQIELQDLFPAQASHYRDNASGFVTLRHPDSAVPAAKNVRLQVFIPKAMEFPSEVTLPELAAGTEKRIPVHLILDPQKFLLLDDNTPAQAEVRFEYDIADGHQSDSRTTSLMVFGKNALDWETPESVAAFVTPQEANVRSLARKALRAETKTKLPEAVQHAVSVWHAMSQQEFSYVKDASVPARTRVLDHVQYPRDTLRQRAGDCDDLSALYASMLEAVGVETAVVLTPGHILVAFSPGATRQTVHQMTFDEKRYIEADGRIWIPVETTMVGKSFEEAWAKGAKLARVDNSADEVQVIPMREAWQVYPPVSLPKEEVEIAFDAKTMKGAALADAKKIVTGKNKSLEAQIATLQKKAKKKKNHQAKNRLGTLLALSGKHSEAETVLRAAIKTKSKPELLVSLGNTLVLQGNTKDAIATYKEAVELYGENGGNMKIQAGEVYNNMGVAYLVAGDQKTAVTALVTAEDLGASSLMATLSGKTMQVEGRGSNEASAGKDTVLDQDLKLALRKAMKKRIDRRKSKRRFKGVSNSQMTNTSRFKDPLPSGGRRGDDPNSKKRIVDLLQWHSIAG
jgi:tetratricopeptide (TPR) repeat protein